MPGEGRGRADERRAAARRVSRILVGSIFGLIAGTAPLGATGAESSDASDPVADAAVTGEAGEKVSGESVPARPKWPSPPAPIGTRFPEPLEGKRLRIGYKFKRTKSQGLLLADRDARPGYVRDNSYIPYTETPRELNVTAHTIEVAYAPHPRTTFILQVPFLQTDLETLEASDDRRRDHTDGVGDITLALLVPFIRKGGESSHIHIAFDFPSGEYRENDRDGQRLPYDSQLGNGSVDFEWGWTYRGERDWLSWGGQAIGRHAIEKNGVNYREGSRFEASLWGGVRLIDGLSASLRVQWQKQNNLRGADIDFDNIVRDDPEKPKGYPDIASPAENGKARGGTRFLIGPGLAYDLPGSLRGHRLAAELSVPFYQNLDGPQLEQDWTLTAGWQWAF
jgi:hypothetical protein